LCGAAGRRLQPVLQSESIGEVNLRLEPIDMVFLALEDFPQQIARDVVLHRLAVRDGILQHRTREALLLEVALQCFERVLADQQLAEILEVRQSLEKQDPLDQAIGMLHLVDRLLALVVLELLQTPVAEHAGVQEVLVDRGELVEQHLVQVLDDLAVAFHAAPGRKPRLCVQAPAPDSAFISPCTSRKTSLAQSRQRPQPEPTPSSKESRSSEQAPLRAHSRTAFSVTALQMQMYKAAAS